MLSADKESLTALKDTVKDSIDESGPSLVLHPEDTNHPPEPPLILDSNKRALQRLLSRDVPQHDLPSVIETVVSNLKAADIVECLQEADAQAFIDTIDEALDSLDLSSRTRRKCVKPLYKTCASYNLLPRSLHFELHGDLVGAPLNSGGFGNVWKRKYCGRDVAVKVLKPRDNNGSREISNRLCKEVITWRALRHPNVLPLLKATMTGNQLAMMSEWMTNENINQFVAAHRDANRFELLGDVARGLIYMHGQGMIHGDLKGAGRACLADFGLLRIVSEGTTNTSSNSFIQGGTCRWMRPELLDPEKFGLRDNRQTRHSDCYAFGMVIREVLSGQMPFSRYHDYAVVVRIHEGERPARPRGEEGMWFTDDVWSILEHCWKARPADRPCIEDVLWCLEKVSRSWIPPSPQTIANPPTTRSLTWNSKPSTEESTDGGELPPSFSEEFGGVLDGASSTNSLSRETPLRQRYNRRNRDSPGRSHVASNEKVSKRRPPDTPGIVGIHKSEYGGRVVSAEAWEPNDPAFGGFTEKMFYGDDIVRPGQQVPGALRPVRAPLFAISEWMKNEKPLIAVVNSIDRSPEDRAPNCCLPFDPIGARHLGIVALSGNTFAVNGNLVPAPGVIRDAEPQYHQKANSDLGLYSLWNGLSN